MGNDFDMPFEWDRALDPESGLLCEQPGICVNFEPVHVCAGDTLTLQEEGLEYKLAFYREAPDPVYLFTYSYQPESNWAAFWPGRSDQAWKTGPTVFSESGYIRIMLHDQSIANHPALYSQVIQIDRANEKNNDEKCQAWIGEEADRVAARARKVFRSGDAAFLLLTDTHYAIGCNWPDTLASLGAVADRLQMQGVIHLGDLTDGLLPDYWTRRYAGRVLDGLHSLGLPYDGCLGNHDSNYFRNNRGIMAGEDLARFYLNRSRSYYYKDLPEQKIRMYFLDSFDPGRQQRYGFSDEELTWLKRSLRKVPGGYRVLFFSHVPPLARLHVWSDEILGEKKLIQILNEYQKNGGKILAWIHGHNHADQVTGSPGFPIVSIGCSKTEAFAEHKPRGSVTYERRLDEPRQELWDILICHAGRHELDLIRFGAGKDRHIEAFV